MKLLCFGEVVWDEISGQRFIGGAPFNVAAHARILGAEEVFLFSAVGRDALGAATRETVRRAGISDTFVRAVDAETCVVRAALDPAGNATFVIPDPASFDQIEVTDDDLQSIRDLRFDYLYFGTIAQRQQCSRASLRRLVEYGGFRHVFCDVNLRASYYDRDVLEWSLRHSDTVKLNEEEASRARRLFGIDDQQHQPFCEWLRREFGIRHVCLTGGEKGAWICSDQGFSYWPATTVVVTDTVGAGDAFSAALMMQMQEGKADEAACRFACKVGSLVASRRGAVPDYTYQDVERTK